MLRIFKLIIIMGAFFFASCVSTAKKISPDKKAALITKKIALSKLHIRNGYLIDAENTLLNISKDSRDYDWYATYALLFYYRGEDKQTNDMYLKSLAMFKDDWRVHNNYAAYLIVKKSFKVALEYLKKAEHLKKNQVMINYNFAITHANLTNYLKAIKYYKKTFVLDKSYYKVLAKISLLYFRLNYPKNTKDFWQKYLQENRGNPLKAEEVAFQKKINFKKSALK